MSTPSPQSVVERRRRLDWASLLLFSTGLVCGTLAARLVVTDGQHPLILIPALLAVYVGARHLTKWEAREVSTGQAATDASAGIPPQ